ncbi:alpha/beta hydrolase family protein [Devosia nitrariae]|uniref:Serine aminopeptidase S33 domain-containing protein n=1 Tax=Devosia nitrariae TaxID=2071872 RepID=A0ABQ5WBE5_9HYPH|nr:alpha/beta fold hydrolase [Devosia nitrariae]GLQ57198.1 hypothetical protein GCM10010862_44570 [Devosia nitrariae]
MAEYASRQALPPQLCRWNNGQVDRTGTLVIPAGVGTVPAVIVLHSAANPIGSAPLYRHLVDILVPRGVAVLRYDRWRADGTEVRPPSYQDLATDAAAAYDSLCRHPRIDPTQIGFWGLSQGGWLALLAASLVHSAAFTVVVSSPMCTPKTQMEHAVANVLRIRGFEEQDVADALSLRSAIDHFALTGEGKELASQRLALARSRPWFDHAYVAPDLPTAGTSRWGEDMRQQPLDAIAKVRGPVLAVYGGHDPWVPTEMSMEALRRLQRPNVTVLEIEDADHVMMVGRPPFDQVDPGLFAKDAPNSSAYFSALTEWLALHVALDEGNDRGLRMSAMNP